jgi:hypothetical protein
MPAGGYYPPAGDPFQNVCFLNGLDGNTVPDPQIAATAAACLTPNRATGKPAFFLFGDSTSVALSSGVMAAVSPYYDFHWFSTIGGTTRGGTCNCGFVPMRNPQCGNGGFLATCAGYMAYGRAVMEKVLQTGDVLSVANVDYFYGASADFMKSDLSFLIPVAAFSFDELIAHYRDLQHLAVTHGAALLLFGGPTFLPCQPFNPYVASVPRQQASTGHAVLFGALDNLTKQLPLTYFFDIHDLLCDANACGALVPGTAEVAQKDDIHLSPTGARYISPFLCSFLATKGLLR